jgi:hypothetical protein
MEKLKKSVVNSKINIFKQEVKSSRVTIDSRICNIDKFNEFFALVDNTKDYKNTISQYCHEQLLHLVSNHKTFVSHYKLFNNSHLNSWEKQALFQEIASHYYETATRYLDKATFISKGNQLEPIAKLIYKQANLICVLDNNKTSNNKVYQLDFNIADTLIQLMRNCSEVMKVY